MKESRCIAKFPHDVIETLPRYRRVIIIRSYISPHFSLNWVIKIISGKITLILKSNHFHQKIIPIYESFCKTLLELIFFLLYPYATTLKSVEHQLSWSNCCLQVSLEFVEIKLKLFNKYLHNTIHNLGELHPNKSTGSHLQ